MLKLANTVIAFLLLVGSTGLVVNKHYCQNELKSTALFLAARSCHQSNQQPGCPMHREMAGGMDQDDQKGCCDDQSEFLKSDKDQIVPTLDVVPSDIPVSSAAGAAYVLSSDRPSPDRQTIHYLNYKPPLIVSDLSVRFQIFRC